MKRVHLIAAAVLALAILCAQGARAATFSVAEQPTLQVNLGDQLIVTEDSLTLADFSKAKRETHKVDGWRRVETMIGGSKKDCVYYRELGVQPDRVEVTWYVKFAPYQFGKNFPGHSYNLGGGAYDIKIPAALLDGASYKCWAGPTLKMRLHEGKLSTGDKDGKVYESETQYISFTPKKGLPFTVDLNPPGVHNVGRKTMYAERNWQLLREGDHFVLRALMRRVKWGDNRRFKVVFYPRGWEFDKIHNRSKRVFSVLTFPDVTVNFGVKKFKSLINLLGDAYEAEVGAGWVEPGEFELVRTDVGRKSIYNEATRGSGKQTLRLDTHDGLYLVNILFGNLEETGEPVDVIANDKKKLTGLATDKGKYSAKTIYAWAEDGHLDVTFDGPKWLLCGLSLTPLIYDTEDYIFNRTWYIRQGPFDKWFATIEPTPPLEPVAPGKVEGSMMEETWNACITTYEAALDSSRAALDTPETARQRLELLKSGAFRWANMGGHHYRWNHVGTEREAVRLRNTRLAVDEAHKLGILMIDHWDYNWVHYTGYPALLEMLDKDPDCLQRRANPLQTATAFCNNSELFVKKFEEEVIKNQKATNVDGYMIDEVQWCRNDYCFCDTCRRKFTEATGLELPADFYTIYRHPEVRECREYSRWHGIVIADVYARLKAAIHSVRSDVILLRYSSSFLSLHRPRGFEFEKNFPWNADYAGDEFHPDALAQNWRVMFARTKSRQGMVASWTNAPTWILPRSMNTARRTAFAWAMSRMNRANVWYRSEDYDLSRKLHTFKYQMDDKNARPVSEVAILLSQFARDYSNDPNYYHAEHMAWLQTMAEENVQHDVIIHRDLTPEKLSKYRVLVMANCALLSDEEVETIRGFVAKGGRVIATYRTAFRDREGEARETPGFAEAMNLRFTDKTLAAGTPVVCEAAVAGRMGRPSFKSATEQMAVALRDPKDSKVLARSDGSPAIVETPYKNGAFIYLAGNYMAQNYEERVVTSRNRTAWEGRTTYLTDFNRDLNHLARNVAFHAIGDNSYTRALDCPRGVVYTAFRQKNDDGEKIVLQVINATGKPDLKKGDEVVYLPDLPQPPIMQDLEFAVASDRPVAKAFAATPEKDETMDLAVKPLGKDRYHVTIPKGFFSNYAVVYLEVK